MVRTFRCRCLVLAGICSILALAPPAFARDGVDFGARTGVYSDAGEAFVGFELLFPVGGRRWFFNPNVEAAFVDEGHLVTLNADLHYDLLINQPTYVWLGAGPALIFSDPPGRADDDETDVGVNLFAGVGWDVGEFLPYVQGKVIVSDDTEFVAAFGIRF